MSTRRKGYVPSVDTGQDNEIDGIPITKLLATDVFKQESEAQKQPGDMKNYNDDYQKERIFNPNPDPHVHVKRGIYVGQNSGISAGNSQTPGQANWGNTPNHDHHQVHNPHNHSIQNGHHPGIGQQDLSHQVHSTDGRSSLPPEFDANSRSIAPDGGNQRGVDVVPHQPVERYQSYSQYFIIFFIIFAFFAIAAFVFLHLNPA